MRALLLLLLLALPARAAEVVTKLDLALPSGTLGFTATYDTMVLQSADGKPAAEVVTMAYGVATPGRPVAFVFNGGPGASSAWLHMGMLGPWRVPLAIPVVPSQDPAPLPNPETWLAFTDLVFIDPPGTGYSRILGDDAARRAAYGVDADIRMLATVIRRWLQERGRLGSPVLLVGESYGGFRVPKVARALLQQQGVGVAGLVLVSPVLDFNGRDAPNDALGRVAALPTIVAAARNASARDPEVEAYAQGEFLTDLVRGPADPAAQARLVARVAALTALDPALVARRGGRIDWDLVLRRPGQAASPYDARISAPDPFPFDAYSHGPDPVLDGLRGPITSGMLMLYRQLEWKPEGWPARQYELLSNQVARDWDYGRSNARPEAVGDLRQALAIDPALRVLVMGGLYDLVTPYFANKLLLDQVVPDAGGERVSLRVYKGGHMAYTDTASRQAMRDDAAALVSAVLAARAARAEPGTLPQPPPAPPAEGTRSAPASR